MLSVVIYQHISQPIQSIYDLWMFYRTWPPRIRMQCFTYNQIAQINSDTWENIKRYYFNACISKYKDPWLSKPTGIELKRKNTQISLPLLYDHT